MRSQQGAAHHGDEAADDHGAGDGIADIRRVVSDERQHREDDHDRADRRGHQCDERNGEEVDGLGTVPGCIGVGPVRHHDDDEEAHDGDADEEGEISTTMLAMGRMLDTTVDAGLAEKVVETPVPVDSVPTGGAPRTACATLIMFPLLSPVFRHCIDCVDVPPYLSARGPKVTF